MRCDFQIKYFFIDTVSTVRLIEEIKKRIKQNK